MRRPAVAVAVALVVTVVISAGFPHGMARATGRDGPVPRVAYRPPVDAPVVDPFRPPPQPWAEGNRGIDYGTTAGTVVRSAADGEVVFAGPVGGSLHVVVLHADGIRTGYSFLESIAVSRGDRVRQGDVVGTTVDRLHFGARAGDTYIDPQTLFTPGPPEVHLVPDTQRRPAAERSERKGLLAGLGHRLARVAGGGVSAVDWARQKARSAAGGVARNAAGGVVQAAQAGFAISAGVIYARVSGYLDELRGFAHYVEALHPLAIAREMGLAGFEWWRDHRDCTPADRPPPPLQQRHLAVLVAGLGSTSDSAAVYGVDTGALGYRPDDVARFSYRGGTTEENSYGPTDTTVGIRRSGRRLRELLARLAAANPGVPIDIVAHSQGGLVARAALAFEYDGLDPRLPPIGALVTLGSPHRGTDGATALRMVGHSGLGARLEEAYHRLRRRDVDPRSDSLRDMSETSDFIRDLNRRPLPAGVWTTSIAARDDLVVPARHTRLAGAHNVVVAPPGGATEHERLPGSEEARREIGLALAHLPPTCRSLLSEMAGAFVATEIGFAEDSVGAGLWAAGRRVDLGGG